MRLFELEELPTDIQTVWPVIKSQCSEFLSQRPQQSMLFRGLDDKYNKLTIFKSISRNDRQAKGTTQDFKAIFDAYLESKGIKANRTNSIPTSPNEYHAKRFGTVYMIFPINGFEWSSQNLKDVGEHGDSNLELDIPNFNMVEELEEKYGFQWDTSLNIPDNLEMLRLQHNIHLSYMDIVDRHAIFQQIEKKFHPHNTDLARSMLDQTEILIHGSYYAIYMNSKLAYQVSKKIGLELFTDEDVISRF